MRLEGHVIIVTGASAGLGKAMAEAFVTEGARVICAARNEERLATVVADLSEGPGEATGVSTDVRSWGDVQSLIDGTTEQHGQIDLLVNNAALRQWTVTDDAPNPVQEIPVDVWDAVLETNLRGYFLCAKAVLPDMLARNSGRIVHVSSGHGHDARSNRGAYSVSKFGVEGLCDTLALELKGTSVDSIALYPPSGGVSTEYLLEHGSDPSSFRHSDPSVIAEPAVKLARGEGEHGGRYTTSSDGTALLEHSRRGVK